MSALANAEGLKKHYPRGAETVEALRGVDFNINTGEMVSLVGPSGSGKTTLMNLVSCLDTATAGRLEINGIEVSGFKESQLIDLRRDNIGFIFQKFHLIPTLTARENIELPLIFAKKSIDPAHFTALIEQVGLAGREGHQVGMLSGGDKQRVAIARALVNRPRLLIADEPTGKLEVKVRDSLMDLFRELAKSGLAVFIATHDLDLAAMTSRIIHLQDGRIVPREASSLYE